MDKLSWFDLLNAYEIDITKGGGADFAELVMRLINGYRWTGERQGISKYVAEMCKTRKCSFRFLYIVMKQAVRPILEEDDETLASWGLHLKKRTSTALAVAIAEREFEKIDARKAKERKPEPVRKVRRFGRSMKKK